MGEEGFGSRMKYSEFITYLAGIFQSDVCAIVRCDQFNLNERYKRQEHAILSDSQFAIRD